MNKSITVDSKSITKYLQRWFQVHSTDREEQFRERTIRGSIIVLIVVAIAVAANSVLLGAEHLLYLPLIILAFTVLAALAVHKGRIQMAGWLLVALAISYQVANELQQGYWVPGTYVVAVLALLLGAILLPFQRVAMIPFVLVILYIAAAFWADAHGAISPFPRDTPNANPASASLNFTTVIFLLSGIGYYLLRELLIQRAEFKQLVATLEERVSERTADLVKANGRLQDEIRERQHAETVLQQTESQLRAILQTSPIAIMVVNSRDEILYTNPVAALDIGLVVESGTRYTTAGLYIDPKDRDKLLLQVQQQGFAKSVELDYRLPNGSIRSGLVSIHPFQFAGQDALLISVVDITELKQTQQIERQQRNLVQSLLDSALILTSSLQLDEVIEHILANLRRIIEHDAAFVLIREGEHGAVLGWKSDLGPNAVGIIQDQVPFNAAHYLNQLVKTHKPILLGDIGADPTFVKITEMGEISSFLGLPIISGQEVIGFMSLGSRQPNYFAEPQVSYLQIFALQAGIAIQNAHLYRQATEVAALEERNKLARDLHDSVTQTLFSANSIAEALPQLMDIHPEKTRKYLDDLHQLTRGAMAEMRSLLIELRPEALTHTELGMLLTQLCDVFTGRTQIEIEKDFSKKILLPAHIQIVFYRIAQEALNNVAKHAQASHVSLSLQTKNKGLEMRIQDDGHGFARDKVPTDHFGLKIMTERATEIHAELLVSTRMNQGTEILLRSQVP